MKTDIQCVGFILDGNRRWAKEKGLPTFEGHRRGSDKLHDVVAWTKDVGIPHVVVYAFSTENWNRSEQEVVYLMKLVEVATKKWRKDAVENDIRIKIAGDTAALPETVQQAVEKLEKETKNMSSLTLTICLSYGGRLELVHAAQEASKEGEVTEEAIRKHLWTGDMPDPDIIIRTGGEKRLSNFLTWQSVYSELFFVDAYWPDFSKEIFHGIIDEYGSRERRRGK